MVLLGLIFVLAYAVRPNTVVVALTLAVLVAARRPRCLIPLLAAVVLAAAGYVATNLATFGVWQPSYYSAGRLLGSPAFDQLFAGWISPNRGVLVWSPVLILAGVGTFLAIRRRTFTGLYRAALAAIVLHWLAVTAALSWTGGYSTGPRLFSDVLPCFILLMIPALEPLRRPSWRGWAFRGCWAVLLAFSLFTHWRGATRFETQLWNSTPVPLTDARMWEWHDLQFLR